MITAPLITLTRKDKPLWFTFTEIHSFPPPNSWQNGRPNTFSEQKTTMMTYPRAKKSKYNFQTLLIFYFQKRLWRILKLFRHTINPSHKGQCKNIIYVYMSKHQPCKLYTVQLYLFRHQITSDNLTDRTEWTDRTENTDRTDRRDKADETDKTNKTDKTGIDTWLSNFCRAAFAILAMFDSFGPLLNVVSLPCLAMFGT